MSTTPPPDIAAIAGKLTKAGEALIIESEPGAWGNPNEGTGAGILSIGAMMAARSLARQGLGDVLADADMYPPKMFFSNRFGLAVRAHLLSKEQNDG